MSPITEIGNAIHILKQAFDRAGIDVAEIKLRTLTDGAKLQGLISPHLTSMVASELRPPENSAMFSDVLVKWPGAPRHAD